ncbi:unnamed protein product [Phaedon cochleariae]|uniref:Uncharacterized protein n=1 Tax=Phaedon cochleariae TaxID=80249 RepID=A0A9P0DSA4_PHACE|nr:unnamed protein product [Phaedon cochleariae]
MRCYVSLVCLLSVLVYVNSAPLDASTGLQIGASAGTTPMSGGGLGGLTNILSQVDLPGLLRGVNSLVKLVGAFCPPLSQILDNVIQNVTSTAFRVFGRAILQNGGLGGGRSGGGGGGKVSVVLPTFPPDEDDEDYDEETEAPAAETINGSGSDGSQSAAALSVPSTSADASSYSSGASIAPSADLNRKEDALYTSPAGEESNLIAKRHVRVTREAAEEEEEELDQDGAESAPEPAEDLSNLEDDQDRDKRFLPFGGSADGHASGGSGNFLFDIIRLVAGSGATEESDEKANFPGGVAEVDVQKSVDHEGIPGPITRLFVIANRGVANLVQDLILRLAQTSERLVNFKARLITSLI